jgi:hypothetical protein
MESREAGEESLEFRRKSADENRALLISPLE